MVKKGFFIAMAAFLIFAPCSLPGYCGNEQSAVIQGDHLIKNKNYAAALARYQEALRGEPDNPEIIYKTGVAFYYLGKFQEAIDAYTKTLQKDPNHYKTFNNLGLVYEKLGNEGEAARLYEKAVQIKPDYRIARYNLCSALYRQDRFDRVTSEAKEMIRLWPDYEKGYYMLGLALENEERYGEAGKMYEKALEINRDYPDAADGVKRIAAITGKSNLLKEEIQAALEIVHFRLPPGYEFRKTLILESGIKIIKISYKGEQDINMVKFPDSHSAIDGNLGQIIRNPSQEFSVLLKEINISQLSLLSVEKFLPDADEKNAKEIEKEIAWRDYARVTFYSDGSERTGVMSFFKFKGDDAPILFIASSPGKAFSGEIAGKFLSGLRSAPYKKGAL